MHLKIKRMLYFLLTIILTLNFVLPVFAENHTITYKSKKDLFDFGAGSGYSQTDLFRNFKNVMPGDVLTETITVKNTATDCDYIKVYLRAKSHDESNPISESVVNAGETLESMNDFLSQLSMKVWNGDKLIFEGSPDKENQLSENTLLGQFNRNESTTIKVELTVPIELDNRYANRIGEVDWVFIVEAFDRPSGPSTNYSQLTVRKLWDDDGKDRPESITVNLLKNGKVHETIELKAENQWMYTWGKLSRLAKWSVKEAEVPDGYTAKYSTTGNTTIITNVKKSDMPKPPNPPEEDPEDKPGTNPKDDPDIKEDNPPINDPEPGTDTPPEVSVPEEGEPVKLTVNKIWNDSDEGNRPDSVTVQLYNGAEGIETVHLGEWNNWSYTWDNLSPQGDWKVVEVNIPKGYTPYYKVTGDIVNITNSAILIQTGQLNWPIPVLGGIGLVILLSGLFLILKKRKKS